MTRPIGFGALAQQMGLTKSWISHCLAGRRRVSDTQAQKLAMLAPETRAEWWLNCPAHRAKIESAVRKISKTRATSSEYSRRSRARNKLKRAVAIIQSWEQED